MTPCHEWVGRKDKDGYGLVADPPYRDIRVHRRAWREANGPIPPGMCVLHKCDNRACHNVEHLFLGTQADNMRDMAAKGRRRANSPVGEKNANAKITWEQAKAIRSDPRRQKDIAAEYGVSAERVYAIKSGKSWKHGNGYMRDGQFVEVPVG